jgi:hypothetical protein
MASGALTFRDSASEVEETEDCLEQDAYSTLTVPLVETEGGTAELVVHAQRIVEAGGTSVAVPLNDRTPWIEAADLTQSIRVWAPYEQNSDLAPGSYQVYGDYVLEALLDGEHMTEIPLEIALNVLETQDAPLEDGYWAGPVSEDGSAVYFQVTDSAIGPNWGVWWEDGVEGPPVLSVPVMDLDTGEATTLYLDAYKFACDYWWDFNSAQWDSHGACDNYAVLYVSSDNSLLVSGHRYQSPDSSPLVLEAYRWHSPNPYTLLETFPLRVSYTAP